MFIDKLPAITIDMSPTVIVGFAKSVRTHMRETKPLLKDYVREMLESTEKELNIFWRDIYRIDATYYTSYDMPVLYIVGSAGDKSANGGHVYMEVHCKRGGSSVYDRYHKQ